MDARVVTEQRASVGVRWGARRRIAGSFRNGSNAIQTATWRRHRDLVGTAATLVGTTGVTAALGFAYWALAARLFSQEAVGYGAAAVSAMTLLGTIGMLGLGTVLISELPRRSSRAGLVLAALLASGAGSLVLGVIFAITAPHFSQSFGRTLGSFADTALFAVGVALTGVSLVFDQATIGLMRGGLQLKRNVILAVTKLVMLPVSAIVLHDQLGIGVTASWICGIALSMALMAVSLRTSGKFLLPAPEWSVLRKLGKTALAHNWLNLSTSLPLTLIPVLVTVIISPTANAAFYAAWTLVNFLRIIPIHLGTVLFAVTSAKPRIIARKLRFTLKLSLIIGLPGMAVLWFGAHLILSLFGAGYARTATLPLQLLVLSYLPSIPKVHYLAVCRALGRVPRAAAMMTVALILEISAAVVGGMSGGLNGLAIALLAVYVVEGVITTPATLRAAFAPGSHRSGAAFPAIANSVALSRASPRVPGSAHGRHRGSYTP